MKKSEKSVVKQQKAPKKNKHPAVWDLVLVDIHERDNDGLKKYGTRLQPFNGRDSLTDLYQELLDAVVYVRQHMEERKEMIRFITSVSGINSPYKMEAFNLLKKLGEIK